MARNLTLILDDQPGQLARIGEAAGNAGVNIRGLAAFTGEGRGVVHILVENGAAASFQAALDEAGIGVADNREVLVVDIEDRPGTLGELSRRFGDANVNIELAYTASGGAKLVVATDDIANARAALR